MRLTTRARRTRRALTLFTLTGLVAVAADTTVAQTVPPDDPPPDLAIEPLVPDETITAPKAPTSRLAETDAALLGRTDDTPVEVLVKLDYDSVATYGGSVLGLAATSPSVTGQDLTGSTPAEVAYEGYIADQEAAFAAALEATAPAAATVGDPLRVVYGGVRAVIPADQIEDVLAIDGVVAVQQDELRQLLTDSSPEFIGATSVYPALGGDTQAGAGVTYGVLDSGAWPEHPSFADQGNLAPRPGNPLPCNFGDNPLTTEVVDPFVCGNKLVGGQAFLAAYLSNPARAAAEPFRTARDSNGHGTHTGSTAGGNVLDPAPVFGVERGPLNGIAPGAWVSVYKVCGIQGCISSDSAAAVAKAIVDGVDVINFSISGGTSPFTDPVELAFLDAYAAGVFVAASAGNSGPGAGTANHVSAWTTTVAASTQTREFQSTLTVTGAGGATAAFDGVTITAGAGPLPIVLSSAAPYSRPLCDAPAPAGLFEGKIVACQRGVNSRVSKGYNVLQGGAEGMILYNPTLADVETDNHWLPTVHLADGTDFLAFMNSEGIGATGQFTAGVAGAGQGDVLAAFSSRGPAGNFVKPDITAPGVQILAGHTPVPQLEGVDGGPNGQYFQAIAGTSMSSPHIAGSALLLAALHPDWTPMQIRSAMMLTATTDVVKEDLVTPANPFDHGAGRIDLTVAGNPGLTMDETNARMVALANDPVNAVHLNLPSINAPTMPGRVTTTRTFTNMMDVEQHYAVETSAPTGSSITVEPRQFTVQAGASATLTITIESSAQGQQFGEIRLLPRGGSVPALHLPVAFVPQQGTVNLMSDCDPDTIARGATSTCTITAQNQALVPTTVDLTTTVNKYLRIQSASPPATLSGGVVTVEDAPLAAAPPGIPAVDLGNSPGFVALTSGLIPVSDEGAVNFTVPAFTYNGVTYTRLGVVGNGYAVAGGVTTLQDIVFDPPDAADPARPNDVLAPFWTDLNGSGAPGRGIRAAIVSSAGDLWVVVEWNVVVFGTTNIRSFQTWIGLNNDANPEQDITFAYAALQADPNGQDFLVGAENVLGQGDMEAVLPSADLRVSSTAQPGGAVTYTVVVRGHQVGPGEVRTQMVSNLVGGTTVVTSPVTVTK